MKGVIVSPIQGTRGRTGIKKGLRNKKGRERKGKIGIFEWI